MIPTPHSVLAPFTGSAQSLSRSLSSIDRLHSQSFHATSPLPHLRSRKVLPHLPTCQFLHPIPHRMLQKAIQYPETRSGSVQ